MLLHIYFHRKKPSRDGHKFMTATVKDELPGIRSMNGNKHYTDIIIW